MRNLINERFGKLLVLEKTKMRKRGCIVWLCYCDCGNYTNIRSDNLITGNSKSCGTCNGIRKNRHSLPDGQSAKNNLYRLYKRGASRRNIVFELSESEFEKLTTQNCFYCNTEPVQIHKISKKENKNFIYNGIDRMDNMLGYIISNCVPCCGICNKMKNNLPYDVFIFRIKTINQHLYGTNGLLTNILKVV